MKPVLLHRWLGQMRDPLWLSARRLLAWQTALERALPAELRGAVVVASWRDGVLGLGCASGLVAARLRQAAPQLAKALSEVDAVRELRVRVMPHLQLARPAQAARQPLPEAALQELERASQHLSEGPLRTTLARMVRRHRAGRRGA